MLEKLMAEAKLPPGEAISDNARSMRWPACGHMYLFMRAPVVGRMPVFELRVTEQIVHSSIYPWEMVKRVGAYLAKADLVNATTKIERNLRLVSSLLNALLQASVIPVPAEVYPGPWCGNDSVSVRAIEGDCTFKSAARSTPRCPLSASSRYWSSISANHPTIWTHS